MNEENFENSEEFDDEEIEVYKSYEIFLHWKQGDDYGHCLGQCNQNVSEALKLWSEHLKAASEHAANLSEMLDGVNLGVCADTHHISFDPLDEDAERVLEACVKEELVSLHVYEQ